MMKKRWILLMMCACISGLGGCGKQTVTEKAEETETADSMKEDTTELCAYIKEINGNTLVIDPVEYISSGDSDRLASYKHTDDDMPDGYYIYNKDENRGSNIDRSDGVLLFGLDKRIWGNRCRYSCSNKR